MRVMECKGFSCDCSFVGWLVGWLVVCLGNAVTQSMIEATSIGFAWSKMIWPPKGPVGWNAYMVGGVRGRAGGNQR